MKEVVPKLSRVGVLGQVRTHVEFAELDAASRKLDIALEVADMQTPDDLDGAFATMIAKRVGAILVVVSPLTYLLKESIAESAIKHRLPTISNANQYADAGLADELRAESARISIGGPRPTSTRSSAGPNPPTCRSSSPRSSS